MSGFGFVSFDQNGVNSALNYMMYQLSGENRLVNFGDYDFGNPPLKAVDTSIDEVIRKIVESSSDGDIIVISYIRVPEPGMHHNFSVGYYIIPLAR